MPPLPFSTRADGPAGHGRRMKTVDARSSANPRVARVSDDRLPLGAVRPRHPLIREVARTADGRSRSWEARSAPAASDRPPRSGVAKEGEPMDVVDERGGGLDVPKRTVVACLLTPGERGVPQKAVRTFGTMTA